MKYYICNSSGRKFEVIKIFDNLDDAYNGMIKFMKKNNNWLEIVPFPEIKIGCSIYKSDGSFYGTIAAITNNIICVDKNDEYTSIPDPFIKDSFEMLVLKGQFILVNGADISTFEEMLSMLNSIQTDVYEIRKRMDYIGSQQISFFGS